MSDWTTRPARVEQLSALVGPARTQVIADLVQVVAQKSADLDALNTAVEALSRLGAEAVPPLLPLLEEDTAETRIAAVLTLGQIGSEVGIPALLNLLDDEDTNIRYHAVEALGRLKARQSAPQLVKLLEGTDYFLIFPALTSLKAIGDPAALPELLARIDDDMVALEAVEAIGACRHAFALPALAEQLELGRLPWTAIVAACETILCRYDETLLGSGRWEADLAGRLGAHALRALLEAKMGEISPLVARGASRLLASAVKHPTTEAVDAETALRRALVLCSAASTPAKSFPLESLTEAQLQAVVKEASPAQKAVLAPLLADSQCSLAGNLLMQWLSDPSEELRWAAALAFPRAPGILTLEELLPFASSPDPVVVEAIHEASDRLEAMDEERWENLLSHPDPACRRLAARAARRAEQLPQDMLLEKLNTEEDPSVRAALLENAMHRRERVFPWLESHWDHMPASMTAVAVKNLNLCPQEAGSWLLRGLDSSDVWTRLQAARLCSEAPHLASGLDAPYREAMAVDPLPPVRAAGLELLPESESLEQRLREALLDSEPEVARAALCRLGSMSSESARGLLSQHYESSDTAEQEAILDALERKAGQAAWGLAVAILEQADPPDQAARLLWLAPAASQDQLIRSALIHHRPDWLRPPPGTQDADLHRAQDALSRSPRPEQPVTEAAWLEAAIHLGFERNLSAPAKTPWAERTRLLGLLELSSKLLCACAHNSSGSDGPARLAGLIVRDFCQDLP